MTFVFPRTAKQALEVRCNSVAATPTISDSTNPGFLRVRHIFGSRQSKFSSRQIKLYLTQILPKSSNLSLSYFYFWKEKPSAIFKPTYMKNENVRKGAKG
jgi:hypothetical protein